MSNRACRIAFLVVATFAFLASSTLADEIVIEEGNSVEDIRIGDFACAPCLVKIGAASYHVPCGNKPAVAMTAGDLWKFFNDHGMDSVDELEFFVDIDQIAESSNFNLDLHLEIQDPSHPSQLLTNKTMGGDSLVVPGYETSSQKPEARIRLALGYDFMKEFSSDSTEKVVFNFKSSDSSVTPTFVLTSDNSIFSTGHSGLLFGFIVFWGLVFLAVSRLIRPVVESSVSQSAFPVKQPTV